MYKMYQTYSEPSSSALAEVDMVKCPNGHYLVDDGPPTLTYLSRYLSEDGERVFHMGCCSYTSPHCTSRDRRYEFRTVRLYCSLCGVCYCEPCMLKHITEGAVFTPFQWCGSPKSTLQLNIIKAQEVHLQFTLIQFNAAQSRMQLKFQPQMDDSYQDLQVYISETVYRH